ARQSTRAFLDRAVERARIERILDLARHAPSGVNIQPWEVAVVSGARKRELCDRIEARFRSGERGAPEYRYYPSQWQGVFRQRRKACGLQLYSALGIGRDDRQRQNEQWAANYRAFDAPVMLLFFMDSSLETGAYLDYGMFLQSLMLAALEEGLATCVQASLAEYPELVRAALGYPSEMRLIGGMALGYADSSAPVNGYRTPREAVDSFTRFFD
ncbi:MAG: nitroreductase, partial [Candidatus Sedimenticola endophacoides]